MLRKSFIIIVLTLLSFSVGCQQNKSDTEKPKEPVITKAQFPEDIAADFPTDLVFTEDKLFFTEKSGRLKEFKLGDEESSTLLEIDVPYLVGYNETGLLGIALSPDFASDKQIYLYHTYQKDSELFNKVIRINTDKPREKPLTIIEGIKGGNIHDGGKIAFGPDANLYIATGEAGQEDLSQDKDSLNGKVLRIEPDGSIPEDNPFGNAVWSYGHRNIFGMTFDNKGNLYVTENGPTENDEVNKIIKGGNYGWPIETGPGSGHFIKPLITFEQSIAPTGIIYYTSKRYKNITDKLIFGDYNNGDVHSLTLSDNEATDKIIANSQGKINAIAQTNDGLIYIATENQIKRLMVDR